MRVGRHFLLILLTVVSCVLSLQPQAFANVASTVSAAPTRNTFRPTVTPQDLAEQAALREDRVEEFRFLRQEAERLGVRVWLFGGTAASYLHYVKWDLQREKGDRSFQADRFDYDFTNIYRSSQDLDIVVDGSTEKIKTLTAALARQYPDFLGGKARWEVRSLRQATGTPGQADYKEALLEDFNFLKQNSDSNSTGMVEITHTPSESAVRDLREWNNNFNNHFLKDSAEDRDTFYRSPEHFQTARARAGQNPEIFSVIRALTKAFQYELNFSKEDWLEMQQIINSFDPSSITDPQALRRLKEMSIKLFKHAVNVEYAWDTLEKMGLRKKLMRFDNSQEAKTLAWWMNKEPLRTYQLGTGEGKTAKELGLDIVAHDTKDFTAYESITRSHAGEPNVFISRQGAVGEAALHGAGFYVRTGREGAQGTGLTVRFHLEPQAREGTDFIYNKAFSYLVIRNKAALKIIRESIRFSPVEYFQWLSSSRNMEYSEKALFEIMRRRLLRDFAHVSLAEENQILALVRQVMPPLPYQEHIPREWFRLPLSLKHPELMKQLLQGNQQARLFAFRDVLSQTPWMGTPLWEKLIQESLQKPEFDFLISRYILPLPEATAHPEWLKTILERPTQSDRRVLEALTKDVLTQPHWTKNPQWSQWVQLLETSSHVSQEDFISSLFSISEIARYPQWIERLVTTLPYSRRDTLLVSHVLSQAAVSQLPSWSQWVETILQKLPASQARPFAEFILPLPAASAHPEWVQHLMTKDRSTRLAVISAIMKPEWRANPKWSHLITELMKFSDIQSSLFSALLRQPELKSHPEWVSSALQHLENSPTILDLLKNPEWMARSEWSSWVQQALTQKSKLANESLFENFLSDARIAQDPQWPMWINTVLSRKLVDAKIHPAFFQLPQTFTHPEWSAELMAHTQSARLMNIVLPQVLQHSPWNHRLDLIALYFRNAPPATAASEDVLTLLEALKNNKTLRQAAAAGNKLNQTRWNRLFFGEKSSTEANPTFANLQAAFRASAVPQARSETRTRPSIRCEALFLP
jgi:hypothetical protein